MEVVLTIITVIAIVLSAIVLGVFILYCGAFIALICEKIGLLKPSKRNTTRKEAADVIDRFVAGKDTGDWDDFCCSNVYKDPFVQKIVDECAAIYDKYPAGKEGGYCNAEGWEKLRELRDLLLSE